LKSNIRVERARLNLSQADVANAIGIHVNMISRYESGVNEPSASVLVRLASFFKCSPDYLLGLCDERHGHIEISKQ
jgi:transcriptional regulator with XRE-family HTH domain